MEPSRLKLQHPPSLKQATLQDLDQTLGNSPPPLLKELVVSFPRIILLYFVVLYLKQKLLDMFLIRSGGSHQSVSLEPTPVTGMSQCSVKPAKGVGLCSSSAQREEVFSEPHLCVYCLFSPLAPLTFWLHRFTSGMVHDGLTQELESSVLRDRAALDSFLLFPCILQHERKGSTKLELADSLSRTVWFPQNRKETLGLFFLQSR